MPVVCLRQKSPANDVKDLAAYRRSRHSRWKVSVVDTPLNIEKRVEQSSEPTGELKRCVGDGQAETVLVLVGGRTMVDIAICLLYIATQVVPLAVGVASFEHQGEFGSSMRMARYSGSSADPEQSRGMIGYVLEE